MGLQYLHVFPYSARPGTPAAKMPQVSGDVAKARAKTLRETGEAILARHLDQLSDNKQTVLVEKPDFGRTESFAPVRLDGTFEPGSLASVQLSGHKGGELLTPHTDKNWAAE